MPDPFERGRASCGVGFVADLTGTPTHETVRRGVECLVNMDHRGAEGADEKTGDGAGIMLQLPDRLLRSIWPELPEPGKYGIAMCFLPTDPVRRAALETVLEEACESRGLRVLGWDDVPVDPSTIGDMARDCMPVIRRLAVAADRFDGDADALERRLYVVRRVAEKSGGDELKIASFSARTVVYKGMLRATQLEDFFPELCDERTESALALMHSRFSTNTFPSWELAHPFRMVAHNGEVNTLTGNRNWMRAREGAMRSDLLGDELASVLPAVETEASDSATIDSVVELLVRAGRSAPHALKLLVPEAHKGRDGISAAERGFVDFHSLLMEPWDGPAAIAFCDGKSVGATLDRNGLRPLRWAQTRDGFLVCASEAGTVAIDPAEIVRRGRVEPGTTLVCDVVGGRLLVDRSVEKALAAKQDYGAWYAERTMHFDDLPAAPLPPRPELPLKERQLAFGYDQEDLKVLIGPLVKAGKEPTGSMGADAALAVLSEREPSLFSYFKQLFAQVTNPAIDPVREEVVMSLKVSLGRHGDLLENGPGESFCLVLERPVLGDGELAKIRAVQHPEIKAVTLDATWPREDGASGLESAVERLCANAVDAVDDGATILIVSDRAASPSRVAIPSLLATAAVHHRLVRAGRRLRTGLVVETGEARETHHIACLVGFGAEAINPYLMLETARDLLDEEDPEPTLVKALDAGLLKVLSKLGISTVSSYRGAQAFEAIGLDRKLIDTYFTGTVSRLNGVGIDELAREALHRHNRAWPGTEWPLLPVGGLYAWRRDGEKHGWNPDSVNLLQRAARAEGDDAYEAYEDFKAKVDGDQAGLTLRGLLRPRVDLEPVPIEEVEPAAEIVKRFATGAMSLGSLSPEAHETLAIAMNRLGGRSNTGEGGEDPRRYVPFPNGDTRRSAIKQVASGRFGVTIGYLMEADQIQIKVAQGAKPGEGGQLPGSKIDRYIGELRYSTPGVELISPPPHHDIYSIEDLKQLIYDLRCANPKAEISVKLCAEAGVGTVAAGVVKAGADHVTVVGHDGGTGAASLSSLQGAGIPWEMGIAETQRVLVEQGLRGRVALQTDGGMRTGRDVIVAALLGAEEVAFSTAPLIAAGCIMMRVCHLNTCPVGIATQDPELRSRFAGTPEHVTNYLIHVAEDVREWMASLGVRTFKELVGQVELLERDPAVTGGKPARVDLSEILRAPNAPADAPRCNVEPGPGAPHTLDHSLIEEAAPALERNERVSLVRKVRNVDRTVGGMLSGAVIAAHGEIGLPEGAIEVELDGSAGQSFGAWLAPGISLTLHGEANDYAGKGLCGGIVAVRPFRTTEPHDGEVIVGNTVLYGATGGRAFFRGRAGERFAVRNSGADAVVEGVGDHGCEYMTGGRVVVLGPTGRNFAAGMSGGIAYVLDSDHSFERHLNPALVDIETLTDPDEIGEVRELIAEHARRTGSPLAERMIEEWESRVDEFAKVMPRDYRRALEVRFQEETAERLAAMGVESAS